MGTGNFIVRVMRQIAETNKGALPYKYEHELHCNEVMLLPYYIASMNIEHEYLAQTGEYRPFDGICLVNTFELALVTAGRRLAELHVHYEQQREYPLKQTWKAGAKLDYRAAKMRLGKDKTTLFYNGSLTLGGIPPQAYDYRLGNRSALEWVIDQYQVSTDKRSGITNDPNRADDSQYILRLIGQVITVSLETVQIVNSLPAFYVAPAAV